MGFRLYGKRVFPCRPLLVIILAIVMKSIEPQKPILSTARPKKPGLADGSRLKRFAWVQDWSSRVRQTSRAEFGQFPHFSLFVEDFPLTYPMWLV